MLVVIDSCYTPLIGNPLLCYSLLLLEVRQGPLDSIVLNRRARGSQEHE